MNNAAMESLKEIVFIFSSTHHMLLAERLLREGGYEPRLIPAPRQSGELCTTAIAVSAYVGEEALDLLTKRGVQVKSTLPYRGAGMTTSLPRYLKTGMLAESIADPKKDLKAVHNAKTLRRKDVIALLKSENGHETICAAAEYVSAIWSEKEAVPAVVLVLSLDQSPSEGLPAEDEARRSHMTDMLRKTSETMRSLGLVYLILRLEGSGEFPLAAEDLRESLGSDILGIIYADELPAKADHLVRYGGVSQILLRRNLSSNIGVSELADEILFLRDNRPNPVGSGNLLPLLSRDATIHGDENRYRLLLGVLRLVLLDAFLPVPEVLWKKGVLCGGNMVILEDTAKGLDDALKELEKKLTSIGWKIKRAGPSGSRQ